MRSFGDFNSEISNKDPRCMLCRNSYTLQTTKPDFKENCKNVNNITFLNNLDLEMTAIFIKTLSVLTCYELADIFVVFFF